MKTLEEDIKDCINDNGCRSIKIYWSGKVYCGIQRSYNDNKCVYGGGIKVFDVGTLGLQKFKMVRECLYCKDCNDEN